MIVKFTYSTNFAGCDGEVYANVPDSYTDNDLEVLAIDFANEQIQPQGDFEICEETPEEIEGLGYEIEDW